MRNLPEELIKSLEKLYEEIGYPNATEQESIIDQKQGYGIKSEKDETLFNLQNDLGIYSLNWDDFEIDITDSDEPWERIIDDCRDVSYEFENYTEEDKKNENNSQDSDLNGCEEFYDQYEEEINEDFPEAKEYSSPCAWYETFHNRSNPKWGIHIKESCLLNNGKKLYKWNKATKTREDAVKAAFMETMCHELFHYISDCTATMIELIQRNPRLYSNYMSKVFWPDFYHDNEGALEESLANRYVYGRYKFMRINKHLLFKQLKSQYKGYRDFDKYLGGNFRKGRRRLINQILTTTSTIPLQHQMPLEQIMDLVDQKSYILQLKVPVWIHRSAGHVDRLKFTRR